MANKQATAIVKAIKEDIMKHRKEKRKFIEKKLDGTIKLLLFVGYTIMVGLVFVLAGLSIVLLSIAGIISFVNFFLFSLALFLLYFATMICYFNSIYGGKK